MKSETISQRENLIIRRHILEPGEALPWHTDLCHRFSVVISGEKLSIGFNARYLLDVLDVMKKDQRLQMEIKTDLAPCVIKCPAEEGFLCVVMPMRI